MGPTASGKTELSLAVARRLGAEIVSLDSMQVYRGLDIGTAKVTPEERGPVPHHMIDVLDPSEELTVAWFQETARGVIEEISNRGNLPLLVGGSGLYWRAVVDDLRFPPRDPDLRASLELEAEDKGADVLHARLTELDPAAAARIEPSNTRRIVRALEVIAATGRRFSEGRSWDTFESIYEIAVAGLSWPREILYERIERRVERMLREGLVEEASRHTLGVTARQALGYRQVLEAPRGASPEALRDEIVRATKRFARRQLSWFRSDPRIGWFDPREDLVPERVSGFLSSSLGFPAGEHVRGQ